MKALLVDKINNSKWWHVTPQDKSAYKKRGKFLASTFLQAEFYGKPNQKSEKVSIKNPVFGFSELEILKQLFRKDEAIKKLKNILKEESSFYKRRIDLDAEMYQQAKNIGFDAIVLMTEQGRKALIKNKKPNSIELNLIIYK